MHETVNSEVPLDVVMGTGLYALEEAEQSRGWLDSLQGHTPETEEYGISSFVFRSHRPLHPGRFSAFLHRAWPGVIRAKGMFWLATRMELAGFLNQAGVMRSTRAMGMFWSAVPESEWPEDAEARAEIAANSRGTYGDRRQELVVIGHQMDRDALLSEFQKCLLTVREMKGGPDAWARLDDPFPEWTPVSGEERVEQID